MPLVRPYRCALWGLFAFATFAACSTPEEILPGNEPDGSAAPAITSPFRYNREYIFVGSGEEPLVLAPFTFRSIDDGTRLIRGSRAWLARGETWDRFHDEASVTSRAGGVWRIVPSGDLRVIAGGPSELESLRYARAERRLRLEFDEPASEWNQGGETRFRLLDGQLTVGSETTDGAIFEVLRVERTEGDGWPTSLEGDAIFLTSGDSLRIMMSDSSTESEAPYTWVWTRIGDQSWGGGEIDWLEMRPLEEARRDIPLAWSIRHDAAGLTGELASIGQDVLLGPERGGRRVVEIRYSVAGWVEMEGEVWPVLGMIRHAQQ